MARKGRNLEKLVSLLESTLSDKNYLEIKSPERLIDRTNGKLREHDVVITINHNHHKLKIAIECRDRSRPIGVNQIEGFEAKCRDTNISQGVLVSSKGFYKSALEKAKHLGIRCLNLSEVESFDWMLGLGINNVSKKINKISWLFIPIKDGIVSEKNFDIEDSQANSINKSILTKIAEQDFLLNLSNPPKLVDNEILKIKYPGAGFYLRDIKTKKVIECKEFFATIIYSIKEEFIPFQLIEYKEQNVEKSSTDAAIASINFKENLIGKFIIIKTENGISLHLTAEKSN